MTHLFEYSLITRPCFLHIVCTLTVHCLYQYCTKNVQQVYKQCTDKHRKDITMYKQKDSSPLKRSEQTCEEFLLQYIEYQDYKQLFIDSCSLSFFGFKGIMGDL